MNVQPIGGDPNSRRCARNYVSLKEKAYQAIKDGIVFYRYRPGEPLVEEQLARELAISRTPVREALKDLQRDGLVKHIPLKGVFVAEVSTKDVEEVFFLREALEVAAVNLAVKRYSDEEIAEIARVFDSLDESLNAGRYEDLFRADVMLHDFIVEQSGNRRLAQFVRILNDQIQRIRRISATTPGRMEESLKEHRSIVEALKRRESDLAGRLLREHLRNIEENALKLCR